VLSARQISQQSSQNKFITIARENYEKHQHIATALNILNFMYYAKHKKTSKILVFYFINL